MKKIVFILFLPLVACKTPVIVPDRVTQEQASFDEDKQNSGLVGYSPKGFELTDNALKRYLDLCKQFAVDPVGVSQSEGKNYLNKEGMVQFMNLTDKKNNI